MTKDELKAYVDILNTKLEDDGLYIDLYYDVRYLEYVASINSTFKHSKVVKGVPDLDELLLKVKHFNAEVNKIIKKTKTPKSKNGVGDAAK